MTTDWLSYVALNIKQVILEMLFRANILDSIEETKNQHNDEQKMGWANIKNKQI